MKKQNVEKRLYRAMFYVVIRKGYYDEKRDCDVEEVTKWWCNDDYQKARELYEQKRAELNNDYDVIELNEDSECRTIGIFKCVLSNE